MLVSKETTVGDWVGTGLELGVKVSIISGVTTGVVVIVEGFGFLILFGIAAVLRKKVPDWSDAGTLADLAVNEPQERRFFQTVKTGWQEEKVERTVWLVKKPGGDVRAFSPNCPHLGCGYRWFSQDKQFKCPCHASFFVIDGKVIAGPAPRPLDTIDAKVEDGKVLVKFEIFQVGTTKKAIA